MISKEDLLKLREKTGAGMLDCKKALEETKGNLEAAIDYLKRKGHSKAASKSERITEEGIISLSVSEDLKSAAMIELKCETDFVSRNEMFKEFSRKVSDLELRVQTNNKEELLKASLGAETLKEALANLISVFGENIILGKIHSFKTKNSFESYIHTNGKIATLIEFKGNDRLLARDIAMHITALNPTYLSTNDIDKNLLETETKRIKAEVEISYAGKPKEVMQRIIQNKLDSFYETICLLNQKFVKEPEFTVQQYIEGKIEIKSYKRIALESNEI